jgi:hypothetical protein
VKQLTVRGFDPELERKLRALARKENISLNQAALRLLRRGAGVKQDKEETDMVGSSLDELIGTWSESEFEEFTAAVEDFEKVDESLWQ